MYRNILPLGNCLCVNTFKSIFSVLMINLHSVTGSGLDWSKLIKCKLMQHTSLSNPIYTLFCETLKNYCWQALSANICYKTNILTFCFGIHLNNDCEGAVCLLLHPSGMLMIPKAHTRHGTWPAQVMSGPGAAPAISREQQLLQASASSWCGSGT